MVCFVFSFIPPDLFIPATQPAPAFATSGVGCQTLAGVGVGVLLAHGALPHPSECVWVTVWQGLLIILGSLHVSKAQ